jgi:hypothetical protein
MRDVPQCETRPVIGLGEAIASSVMLNAPSLLLADGVWRTGRVLESVLEGDSAFLVNRETQQHVVFVDGPVAAVSFGANGHLDSFLVRER